MKKALILIDEYGNTHTDLSKAGTFSHFIFASVIIPFEKYEDALRVRKSISNKFFQGRNIKASNLKEPKKLLALQELFTLNPVIMLLVVDKEPVNSAGLNYHQSFYKYFNRLLVEHIKSSYDDFDIIIDKHGYPDFQKSLKTFIDKNLSTGDLFSPLRSFHIADDKEEQPLLQLADIAANIAGNIYCVSHRPGNYQHFFDSVRQFVTVDFFPEDNRYLISDTHNIPSSFNSEIRQIALNSARQYLENKTYKDHLAYREILDHILLNFNSDCNRLVPTYELLLVARRVATEFSEYQLRQAIAHFRDNRVLVMSLKGKQGYKMPSVPEDVFSFYNRFASHIVPMLRRISTANSLLRESSFNNFDFINQGDDIGILRSLLDTLESKSP